MKILFQLLKEFWLPLILGVAWTLYNVADKPPESWTAKELINIFGPTFFFASWLVAQWYRVRKQQRVESGLTDIRSDIHGLHFPLLPCVVFSTLKYKCFPDELEYAFSGCDGYKKYGPDSILKPSGSVKMNSACNPIEHKAEHSHCAIRSQEKLAELAKGGAGIFQTPVSVKVEFHFGKAKKKNPSLILESGHSTTNNAINIVITVTLYHLHHFQKHNRRCCLLHRLNYDSAQRVRQPAPNCGRRFARGRCLARAAVDVRLKRYRVGRDHTRDKAAPALK
jgi:hypothetical protein